MPNRWHVKRKDTPAERARKARYASPEHRAASRALAAEVDAGRGYCWRCGGWIDPHAKDAAGKRAWHVGHLGSVIRGPEHSRCNLRAAARDGARKRNGGQGGSTRVRL